eukprot:m.946152 g.946152  ORF g.946152 m.946152 type:complete len:291 (+) comp23846_c0_seq1:143-1015(+)
MASTTTTTTATTKTQIDSDGSTTTTITETVAATSPKFDRPREQLRDAYAECQCGSTVISVVGTNEPLGGVRVICACCDCRTHIEWCKSKGGPSYSPKLCASSYWKNDLMVIRGREYLKAYKLTADSPGRRLIATCCYTAMFLDHPFYEGKYAGILEGDATDEQLYSVMKNSKKPPYAALSFRRDISPETSKAYPPEFFGLDPKNDFTGDEPDFLERLSVIMEPIGKNADQERHAQTLQEIIEDVGTDIMNANSEANALGGPYQKDYLTRVIVPMMAAVAADAKNENETTN